MEDRPMRQEVTVRFGPRSEFVIPLPGSAALPADDARRWLDQQFIANECEPLRASGKVLTADKVLALADTVGPQRFESDPAFRDGFAQAVVAALGQAVVRVDLEARTLTY
jgi:hypothetical protein